VRFERDLFSLDCVFERAARDRTATVGTDFDHEPSDDWRLLELFRE
jgi:hypothetical protein